VEDILVDPDGTNERSDYWDRTGHALLVGAILHVLYAEPDTTLAGVATFLSNPAKSFSETLTQMMATPHLPDGRVHPVVASAAREMLNKSPNELSGVLSTAMSFLGLYRDPIVARATSTSDFTLTDLVQATTPVSLYLVVPPSDIARTRPLIRLLLNQMGRRLTERLEETADPAGDRRTRHALLFLLDEFPLLGRLEFFQSALAYMAGYGLRAFLVVQSLNQLDQAYGPNNAILDNCHIRVAFASNDDRTAKRIAELLGTTTETRQAQSHSGKRWALWLDHQSVAEQEIARPLLTPGEIMQLPDHEQLVFVGGMPPIRARKLRYFADATFLRRAGFPPPACLTDPPSVAAVPHAEGALL
jgi:type IV secretion system protein VirD4